MTTAQAVRLALRALAAECRRLAVDANLAERYGADYPGAREAAKLRGQYRQAADVLADQGGPAARRSADTINGRPAAGSAGNGARGGA